MSERRLTGGNNTAEVVLVDGVVHRSPVPFAATVLTYLASAGYEYAPAYLGVDEQGRDMFAYVPGETSDHPAQRAPGAYAKGARMLRELHDLTAGHELAAGRECVTHGDPGPFNAIFRDGQPVVLIDWEGCRPGDRLDDLGYLAWTWCLSAATNVPIEDQARYFRETIDGYGGVDPAGAVAAVVRRQDDILEAERANMADPRHSSVRRRHAAAAIAWAAADREWVLRHRDLLVP